MASAVVAIRNGITVAYVKVGRCPTNSIDSATNGTEIASDAQNARCLRETSGLQSATIAIRLARPT